jgi:uncharacterized integral membrane protein
MSQKQTEPQENAPNKWFSIIVGCLIVIAIMVIFAIFFNR